MMARYRLDRWPVIWASLTMLLIGVVVALSVALHATTASANSSKHASQIASCINSILAARAPLTVADHANERQKIVDQRAAVLDQRAAVLDQRRGIGQIAAAKTQAEGLAGFHRYQKGIGEFVRGIGEFVRSLANWEARDNAIAALKRAHPLGKC